MLSCVNKTKHFHNVEKQWIFRYSISMDVKGKAALGEEETNNSVGSNHHSWLKVKQTALKYLPVSQWNKPELLRT